MSLGLVTSWSFATLIWNKVQSSVLRKIPASQSLTGTNLWIAAPSRTGGGCYTDNILGIELKTTTKQNRGKNPSLSWVIY